VSVCLLKLAASRGPFSHRILASNIL